VVLILHQTEHRRLSNSILSSGRHPPLPAEDFTGCSTVLTSATCSERNCALPCIFRSLAPFNRASMPNLCLQTNRINLCLHFFGLFINPHILPRSHNQAPSRLNLEPFLCRFLNLIGSWNLHLIFACRNVQCFFLS